MPYFEFWGRKSNGRLICRTFSFPYFYYTMSLNFRVQNFSKKIRDFLIFSFSLLIFKDYFLLKICIKIDKNMKFYVFCCKKTGQKSVKNSLFFSLIFVPKSRQIKRPLDFRAFAIPKQLTKGKTM